MKPMDVARVVEMVMGSLQSAESAHPVFASRYLADGSLGGGTEAQSMLSSVQRVNDQEEKHGGCAAESLLLEEMLEADLAYRDGNYSQCLRELSHCGAVVLRTMLMVIVKMSSGKKRRDQYAS